MAKVFSLLLIGALALTLAAPVLAAEPAIVRTQKPLIVEIDFGSAEVKSVAAGAWAAAQTGQLLWPGDELMVGGNSRVTLVFFEGSILQVEHDTHITVVNSDAADTGGTRISIFQASGNTWSRVVKLVDSGSFYGLLTPAGVGLVRGTEFKTTVHPDGSTDIRTVEGAVELSKSDQAPGVLILPGQVSSISPAAEERPKEPRGFKLSADEDEELASLRGKSRAKASSDSAASAQPAAAGAAEGENGAVEGEKKGFKANVKAAAAGPDGKNGKRADEKAASKGNRGNAPGGNAGSRKR